MTAGGPPVFGQGKQVAAAGFDQVRLRHLDRVPAKSHACQGTACFHHGAAANQGRHLATGLATRGLPQRSAPERTAVGDANIAFDFAALAMQAAADAQATAVLSFPENLGRLRLGTPAPIWRDSAFKALGDRGNVRGATYRCQ